MARYLFAYPNPEARRLKEAATFRFIILALLGVCFYLFVQLLGAEDAIHHLKKQGPRPCFTPIHNTYL